MDPTEAHVARYLAHLGYTDVVYEPDGKIPPDFLIDGRIAVEVRRLNQNHISGTRTRGLEEVARPLIDRLKKLIESLGPSPHTESWFVFFRFRRPVPNWDTLKGHITQHLTHFSTRLVREPTEFEINRNFKYGLIAAGEVWESYYRLGGYSDYDSGGWVLAEMLRNLDICLQEKTAKIAPYRARYREWWLILTDHIGMGTLDDYDRDLLRREFKTQHNWDKIILINPQNSTQGFELSCARNRPDFVKN